MNYAFRSIMTELVWTVFIVKLLLGIIGVREVGTVLLTVTAVKQTSIDKISILPTRPPLLYPCRQHLYHVKNCKKKKKNFKKLVGTIIIATIY